MKKQEKANNWKESRKTKNNMHKNDSKILVKSWELQNTIDACIQVVIQWV